jgi:drug/metabolite transporter (DMT)-like permease
MAGVHPPGTRDTGTGPGRAVPGVVAAPPRGDLLLMPVGILAVSTSGPLMAAAAAPALAVALWRNVLATAVIGPYALLRHRRELAGLSRRELRWAVGSGLLLTLHFATWTPSVRYTSVASATAIVCAQPVWVALLARAAGHHAPRRAWWGIGLSVVSVVLLTGVDFSLDQRALAGDLLALLGGAFGALYTVAGAEVRRTVSTTSYTLLCYGTAGAALLVVCAVAGLDLVGYSADTWLKLLALAAGAQLLGHSLFNRVLRTTSPTVVSLAILFEVPGAATIAALTLGQTPPLAALPAAVLLLLGIAVVISARPRGVQPAVPVE